MQIQTTKHYFTPTKLANIKPYQVLAMWSQQRGAALIVGGSVNWYHHFGVKKNGTPVKFKMRICSDPTISILNYALEKLLDMYTRGYR